MIQGRAHPGQTFLNEVLATRSQFGGAVEGADVEVLFTRCQVATAGQGGTAPLAKPAHCLSGGTKAGDLTGEHHDIGHVKTRERGRWGTAMAPTALAVTPDGPFRFASRQKAHIATKASAVPDLGHGRASQNMYRVWANG